ncbi:MAG TPA: polysaccharide deacetylase family protein [Chitinophagaceae bacterium]|nr:polysaccharide deacetylase family protein [Chitinophagaceae bacterium]
MFYLVKTPPLIRKLYPGCAWTLPAKDKVLFMTFDDGPNNEVTPFVLEELKKFNARATFFCIGKNVRDNFEMYQQVISEGHKVGNHTFNHLNGWKTNDKKYIEDIIEAKKIIDSDIFRPPYGRITRFQLNLLRGEAVRLKTVMWDVLSGDFDTKINGENCYLNVIKNAVPGSIIVFHDSVKAKERLEFALPRVLQYFTERGYHFNPILL